MWGERAAALPTHSINRSLYCATQQASTRWKQQSTAEQNLWTATDLYKKHDNARPVAYDMSEHKPAATGRTAAGAVCQLPNMRSVYRHITAHPGFHSP
jgi:hypothetical protein